MLPFSVYFTNHGYYAERRFASLLDAIAYGKSVHFEFSVHDHDGIVVAWSPIGGLRHYRRRSLGDAVRVEREFWLR